MIDKIKEAATEYNKSKSPGVTEWIFGILAVCSVLPVVIGYILTTIIIDTTKHLVKKVWK